MKKNKVNMQIVGEDGKLVLLADDQQIHNTLARHPAHKKEYDDSAAKRGISRISTECDVVVHGDEMEDWRLRLLSHMENVYIGHELRDTSTKSVTNLAVPGQLHLLLAAHVAVVRVPFSAVLNIASFPEHEDTYVEVVSAWICLLVSSLMVRSREDPKSSMKVVCYEIDSEEPACTDMIRTTSVRPVSIDLHRMHRKNSVIISNTSPTKLMRRTSTGLTNSAASFVPSLSGIVVHAVDDRHGDTSVTSQCTSGDADLRTLQARLPFLSNELINRLQKFRPEKCIETAIVLLTGHFNIELTGTIWEYLSSLTLLEIIKSLFLRESGDPTVELEVRTIAALRVAVGHVGIDETNLDKKELWQLKTTELILLFTSAGLEKHIPTLVKKAISGARLVELTKDENIGEFKLLFGPNHGLLVHNIMHWRDRGVLVTTG
jgi:hypothetical protein